ncbi:MAG: PAS domain S-box protein [Anaerolineales bacterium]|nr:PAS domain S-box protein [Anaerolineales bacterium]
MQILKDSELRYRRLFEAAQDGILILDAETGMIEDVNPYLINMLGYSYAEFIKKKIWELRSFQDIEASQDAFKILQENEYIRYEDLPLKAKDGRLVQVEFISNVYWAGDEKVIQCNIRNITERRRSESALQVSEARYRRLFEAAQDGILILDAKTGMIEDVNPYLINMLGYSREEFIKKKLWEVGAFRDIEASKDAFEALQANEYIRYDDLPLKAKDGRLIPVEFVSNVYFEGDEKVIQCNIRDITARKHAEESIHLQSTALNAAASAIMITDRDGTIEWINLAFTTLTGYTSEEAVGRNPRDLIRSGKQDQAYYKQLWDTILAGEVWHSELINRRKDGSLSIEEETITPLKNASGKISHFIAFKQDIAERKQAEARIQRQLEHLTALSAIDRVIAANFDLKLSLSEILAHVTKELGVDAADILILNPDSNMLEYGSALGFRTKAVRKAEVRLGESYAGRVALERQLVQIPDLRNEPENPLLTSHLAGEGFACYYGVPLITKGQVKGVLEVFNRIALAPDGEWLDFLDTLAGQTAIALENSTLFESLQRSNVELSLAYDATIEGWSRALDLRDKETEGHTQRVTAMTVKLARAFGFSKAELVQVRWGALLHDIGKMGVPDGILLKPGPLTEEEWVVMKNHPTFAYEMLSPIRYLRLALDIPNSHHEKWDGSGYPHGLKGTQIPLVARIFAVVDVWDALSSDRPYRSAWAEEKVREHILASSGTHFDPQVVDLFMQIPK